MNNYDNTEPKPLKFLVSDGKLVDESGNVIAESDSLQDLYIKSSPQVKKYLLSDGSVVDENNNLIIKNDYYKKVYDQATPKVAKYLHSDGTIDENPGSGGGADLEDNHQTTINVSTYTEPVEITPSEGKDGMKKVTVTLSNIPSTNVTAYAWYCKEVSRYVYVNFNTAPLTEQELKNSLGLSINKNGSAFILRGNQMFTFYGSYTRVSETKFTTFDTEDEETLTYTRDSTRDFSLWETV